MARPPRKQPDLPPAVFDPGEVTATYPVGALTKNLNKKHDDDDGTAAVVSGLQGDDLHTRETVPGIERTDTPEPHIETRSKSKSSDGPSPAMLMALSLLGGGGLAVVVVLVGLAVVYLLG